MASLDLLIAHAGKAGRPQKGGQLLGSCEMLLQGVKEENRPFLSRALYDLKKLPSDTSAFERILIKDARWLICFNLYYIFMLTDRCFQ